MRDQQREKILSQEELTHAEATLQTVQSELAAASASLQAAEMSQGAAVVSVYSEHIQVVLDHLVEANRLRMHLQLLLKGCGVPYFAPGHWQMLTPDQRRNQLLLTLRDAGLPFGAPEHWEELHAKVSKALNEGAAVGATAPERAVEDARQHWHSFASALLQDPDAKPGLPPAMAPLWNAI